MPNHQAACIGLLLIVMGPNPSLAGVAIPNEGGDSCAMRFREAKPDEQLVRERNPLLGAPEDMNNAPGPGSLRAVVRGGRPFVFIVDTASGASRELCPGTGPRFSPDGRWIACNRWLSSEHPYNLALVDARTGKARIADRVGEIDDYAWSPDSRRLAFTSYVVDTGGRMDIGWIEIGSAAVHVLASDRDPHVEWLELEWAPDSRRFQVRRHRAGAFRPRQVRRAHSKPPAIPNLPSTTRPAQGT